MLVHRCGAPVGSFHVTQVSMIITQVKNKIAYHLKLSQEIEIMYRSTK